ncbi:MAG: hypothetical protein HDR01_16355 [Lachnospiraceae bacterium]|nr:hypothetical protein [Lachnospiraceae bacterium]
MSKILIFLNEVKREEQLFHMTSNFIAKFSNEEKFEKKDVANFKSKIVEKDNIPSNLALMKYIENHRMEFKDINKPEKMYMGLNGFEVIFCVVLNMNILDDISELCDLILIKRYYKNLRIMFLFRGEQRDYFKVSHFFSTISKNDKFYNDVYYYLRQGGIQRLQKRAIGALTHFLPVQWVDTSLLNLFSSSITEYILPEEILKLLSNKADLQKISGNEILYGSMALLQQNKSCFPKESLKEIVDAFASMNILSWTFLTYSLREFSKKKNVIGMEQLYAFVRQMKLYANGCMQLLENIVFHSSAKEGIFSFRIYSGESEYILNKYDKNKSEDKGTFLEVIIADYTDGCKRCNIAQNFLAKMKDDGLRDLFFDFVPIDFFRGRLDEGRVERNRKRWISYYENRNNIGKHFGIRIFENIIKQSNGRFVLESHAGHESLQGESWKKVSGDKCLPGTKYTILLPIKELQKRLLRSEIGIDKDIDIEGTISKCLNYSIISEEIKDTNHIYTSQEEKETQINCLSNKIMEICEQKAPAVWYISAADWKSIHGELFCKAIMLTKLSTINLPHFVLYECGDDFINTCIHTTASVFQNNESVYALTVNEFQIALFAKDTYNEVILVPDNYGKTVWLNEQMNFSRNIIPNIVDTGTVNDTAKVKDIITEIIPYDVLCPVLNGENYKTLFEYYTKKIIEKDIQEKTFGCKINDTHMRLGSTIHVDLFYEAELLFGNKLFISRFAYLIVKDLADRLNGIQKITLYGYATYSEPLVFEIMNIIRKTFHVEDVDYAILEREMENRGDSHVDRIRYSHYMNSAQERKEYFKDRSIVCIVPIASTLKTNEKLINLFCNDNGENCINNILDHYVLVLVGPKGENNYWKIEQDNRIVGIKNVWKKIAPKFFVDVCLSYEEAMECRMCFPENVLYEKPLIEVNAASTIPNQAFGLYGKEDDVLHMPEWEEIEKEQGKLECLKDSMIYSHVRRGENHFLYYVQTEKLSVQYSKEIEAWLKLLSSKIKLQNNEYHVIFCPSHFSNAGFLELVNRIVFHDAAILIRDDVDKEYRSNIMAKYSNICLMFEKLEQMSEEEKIIKFYYVDDSIVTGRTFWRSKSLVEAVAALYSSNYKKIKVHIFEKIFVLVDRNSSYSKMQYLRCWEKGSSTIEAVDEDYFAFRTLAISSLRNHGDSCVICKLEKEAEILYSTSSTLKMSSYWKNEKEKFKVKSLKSYLQENQEINIEKKERAYRRMVCTHTVHTYINEKNHGNHKDKAVQGILQLLLVDYMHRSEAGYEYFLSYLKVLSRPFIVFNKCMKQAVFDILLLLVEWQLTEKGMKEILSVVQEEKGYLLKEDIQKLILLLEEKVLRNVISLKDKKDLLLVLLKQLTELKSNYVIRIKNINKITKYVERFLTEEITFFYKNYLQLVKQLIGVNSDTSKSAWLDYMLHNEKEYGTEEKIPILLPKLVKERMYIENTRVLLDGIKKLCDLFPFDNTFKVDFCNFKDCGSELEVVEQVSKIQNALTDYQFGNFKQVLKDYRYIKEGKDNQAEFLEEGKVGILSSMVLFQLLNEDLNKEKRESVKQEEILKKCHFIVVLIKNIFHADSVKIVMETDAEYDEWISKICNDYNELADCFQKINSSEKIEYLNISPQKEYILLADSTSIGNHMQEFDSKLVSRMENYRRSEQNEGYGYVLNYTDQYLVWEMEGRQEHPIFIYAEWIERKTEEKRLNNVRNGMMFHYLLNEKIFSDNDGGQLYELITNSRDLRMSNRSKANSHTKNDVRLKQYEQVCDAKKYQKYYRCNVLTLLADLNVSEIYRKSLKKDYYLDSCNVTTIKWEAGDSIFNKEIPFYCTRGKFLEPLEIQVLPEKKFDGDEEIGYTDELLCYNVANAGREVYLLLYSLILNAGVEGRSSVTDDKVKVYLSKTKQGDLRMANLAGWDKRKAEEINKELKHPPANEEDGISLWSMSRYIKGIICSIMHESYNKLTENIERCKAKDILEYKGNIEKLLGSDFEVKADWIKCGEELYFSLEIPILAERYWKFLKCDNAEQVGKEKDEEISAD